MTTAPTNKVQEHEIQNDIMLEYITYKNLLQILYISIKRSEWMCERQTVMTKQAAFFWTDRHDRRE